MQSHMIHEAGQQIGREQAPHLHRGGERTMRRLVIVAAVLALSVAVLHAAISLFDFNGNPSDTAGNSTAPVVVTPLASMAACDLAVVAVADKLAATGVLSVSANGWQAPPEAGS